MVKPGSVRNKSCAIIVARAVGLALPDMLIPTKRLLYLYPLILLVPHIISPPNGCKRRINMHSAWAIETRKRLLNSDLDSHLR